MQKPRAVYIEWHDAHSHSGWRLPDETYDLDKPLSAVGFLVQKTKRWVRISNGRSRYSGRDGKPDYCDILSIPREAITRLERIEIPKETRHGKEKAQGQKE